jgi:phage FluMu protein Com
MEIIKRGSTKEKGIKKKCEHCKTVFKYTKKDVESDWRDGDYVKCPVCKEFLAVGSAPEQTDRSQDC